MEGVSTLLRVRTLTDVEGSPASTSGPSPRTALPREGEGGRVFHCSCHHRCLVLAWCLCECKAAAGPSPASAEVSAEAEEAPTRNSSANAQN